MARKTPPSFPGFRPALFEFLEQLADNNHRDWFTANKDRYEHDVREPCLAFIRAFQAPLKKISPCFVANDRKVGGSLMRVHRDTRFSHDKTPYKTNVGIQFRHDMGKDVHAPGFYVHLAPGECFLGVGVWRPDAASLLKIRKALAEKPGLWKRVRDNRNFRAAFALAGESLTLAPRGFAKDHPYLDDLKRKDFLGLHPLDERDVLKKGFLDDTIKAFAGARPFVRYLCETLVLPF